MPIGKSIVRAGCGAALLAAGISTATPCELQSPPHRAGLLELYTSEGCNSCPPADQWLSRLHPSPRTDGLVALAFHVDYWNQLGWPDRFSRPQYTRRQQESADRNRAGFVYTPQFLLDGKDIRPLNSALIMDKRLATLRAEPAQAQISARIRLDGGQVHVEGSSTLARTSTSAATFIALYENGLSSAVARGENAGKTLRHDYVVRELVGPLRADARGVTALNHRLAVPAGSSTRQLGVAVFTQDAQSGRVLQAATVDTCL